MKKKISLISTSIIVCLIIIVGLLNTRNNVTFKINGITYALTVDGVRQNTFPEKGLYKVITTCENAICKWDYNTWELIVEDSSNKNVTCSIEFITTTANYFNEYLINLETTSPEQGIGKIVHETFTDSASNVVDTGYRYEGQDPNNYVWFNNELWQIIGVMNESTHGQTDDSTTEVKENQLVKIIRADSIGALAWNGANRNDWANSSLYRLLNPISGYSSSGIYYNKKNDLYNSYCYKYSTSVNGNCDFSNTGIDSIYREMIKEVTWKVGGHTTNSATAEAFYTAERGSTTGNSNAYASEVTGYIGLMYVSDYGYSVLADSCTRKTSLSSYGTSACSGQSWLGGKGYQAVLTPYAGSSVSVFEIWFNGQINTISSSNGLHTIRPTLYLNSSVYVIDGDGSYNNPYIIGM